MKERIGYVNFECGINRFNRTSCIQDDVYSYYQGGQERLAAIEVCSQFVKG